MGDDQLTTEQWEQLCKGCGECCLEKFEDERGTIFYTMKPCRYLDVETRQCRIYHNRFAINPECVKLTPELVASLRWLPRDCGYVAPHQTEGPPAPERGRGRRRRSGR